MASTPFFARALLYAALDEEFAPHTRFFSAASQTNRILHHLFPAARRCFGVSKATEAFLIRIGGHLERINVGLARTIRFAPIGADWDRYLIAKEQAAVQVQIEALTPLEYPMLMNDLDGLLGMGVLRECLAQLSGAAAPYIEVLRAVRLASGRSLSFARQDDREAIGLGLIEAARRRFPAY